MVVAAFSVTDQADKIKFFEETFLVANVSPDVVLGMTFRERAMSFKFRHNDLTELNNGQ